MRHATKKIFTRSVALVVVLVSLSALFVHAYSGPKDSAVEETASGQETLCFPLVDGLDPDCVTRDVQKAAEEFYGKDFSQAEVYGSWDAEDLERDIIDVAFMDQEEGIPYIASVDPQTKQIIAMETVAGKGDQAAKAEQQKAYATAAEEFLSNQLNGKELGEQICRLPAPNGKESDRSVYVFFPECFSYVEISASSDLHLIGYRYFGNAEEMNEFMETQSHAL